MKLYGLTGYPLSHSFSKRYFTEKFQNENLKDEAYENFPIDDISKLLQIIIQNPDLIGLNVTIPYKEQVIPLLHEIDDVAKSVGAVNTIKIKRIQNEIHLTGYNTDVFGFRESLVPLLKSHHTNALILGTGGASKAIKFVLQSLNIGYLSVSRNPAGCNCIGYKDINKQLLEKFTIIINTTPVGTYPETDKYPELSYHYLGKDHLLYDLVYNPEVTKFLDFGIQQGAVIKNGMDMLHLQAIKSYEIWNTR